ncbi:MAG: hypothetical protein ACFBZ8_11415 [Opitutales bacterium]
MAAVDEEKLLREKAWLGDAILALWARRWILDTQGRIDDPLYQSITSNQFLASQGRPVAVEAAIADIYERDGLEAAFAHLDANFLPLIEKRLSRDLRSSRTTRKK